MHAIDNSPEALANQMVEVFITVMKQGQGPILEMADQFDLTLSQLKMLMILANAERPLALNELADATTLSMPAAGRAVDALLRNDLVSRREDELDRRVKRVALTDKGTEATGRVAQARLDAVTEAVSALSAKERTAFAAALEPLIASLPDRNELLVAAGSP